MRKILFRGKRKDNGEWVEGYLVIHNEKYYIYYETADEMCQTGNWLWNKEVIPETVGQYTDVDDKNGKKIFEGDIIHYEIQHSTERGIYKDNKYNHAKVGPVIFSDQCFLPLTFCVHETILVVGNIHDNPKLEVN